MPGASPQIGSAMRQATPAAGPALPRCFLQGASVHNLHQLVVMRNVAIVGQTVTLIVVDRGLGIPLPVGAMAAVILALALFNAATWRALGRERPDVSERDLTLQLMVDVAALAVQLGLAGGAGNPFVGMFLLPLAITAASLPWKYTWLVALFTVACHSVLVFWFRPLFAPGDEARQLQLMTAGMWINDTITAGMVAFFVVRIAMGLRASERALAETREREIRTEHVVRIGTLAAGAAHELAQPMATLSLLMSELEERTRDDAEVHEMVQRATQQLSNGRQMLGSLLSYGRTSFDTRTHVGRVDEFLRDCLDTFGARQPGARVTFHVDSPGEAPGIRHDLALRQAIIALLGNAADVSPQWMELRASWNDDEITLSVLDKGPGIAADVEKQIGKMFFTTKPAGAGNGLGLNLAHTAVTRLGGMLQLGNLPEGGACARIVLPVEPLAAEVVAPAEPPARRG